MSKKVAIIIPAYNARNYIHNLIRTIYAQTYIDLCKIIIINDDEDSATYDFLYNQFQSLDMVILKSDRPQGGPGSTRNVGLKYVIKQNIPYIIFADADDIFYSTMAVEVLYNTIKETGVDYISSPFIQKQNNSLENNYDKRMWLFGKIYKTQIIKDNNIFFPETFIAEDQSFNLIYNLYCRTAYELTKPLYLQKQMENSLTNNPAILNVQNYFLKTYKVFYLIYKQVKDLSSFKEIIPERVIYMYQDYNRIYNMVDEEVNLSLCNELVKKIYQHVFKDYWSNYTQNDWWFAWKRTGGLNDEIPNIGFVDFLKIMTEE